MNRITGKGNRQKHREWQMVEPAENRSVKMKQASNTVMTKTHFNMTITLRGHMTAY